MGFLLILFDQRDFLIRCVGFKERHAIHGSGQSLKIIVKDAVCGKGAFLALTQIGKYEIEA
jgi:hypothetical protein